MRCQLNSELMCAIVNKIENKNKRNWRIWRDDDDGGGDVANMPVNHLPCHHQIFAIQASLNFKYEIQFFIFFWFAVGPEQKRKKEKKG